jgi:hypothetical protein
MNHAITIGGLLLSVGALIGIGMFLFGGLMFFAAGMSDADDDGTAKQGCIVFALGAALTIGCLIGMFA